MELTTKELDAEILKRAFFKEGKTFIKCAVAFDIAEKHNIPLKKVAKRINAVKIRIEQCQLGCF